MARSALLQARAVPRCVPRARAVPRAVPRALTVALSWARYRGRTAGKVAQQQMRRFGRTTLPAPRFEHEPLPRSAGPQSHLIYYKPYDGFCDKQGGTRVRPTLLRITWQKTPRPRAGGSSLGPLKEPTSWMFLLAHSISHSLSHQDNVRMFDLQGMPGVSGLAPEVDVGFCFSFFGG